MNTEIKSYKNILVVLESNEDMAVPLARAASLCNIFSANMTVFVSFHNAMLGKRSNELTDDLTLIVNQCQNAINEQIKESDAEQFLSNIIMSWKQIPSIAVKELISSHNFDLVLKTPYQQGEFKKLFRSGLDHYFVRDCPLPLWMVKSRLWDEDIEVLACVDMSDNDFDNHMMNKQILATSDKIAGWMNGKMHVVDCYYGEIGTLRIDHNNNRGFKREATIKEKHIETLKLYISDYALADDQLHFEEGLPDGALPEKAAALNAEVTVIGNNEDSNFMDRLFGDTAVELTRAMPCDILVLKPTVAKQISPKDDL